jgi:hypothetical protein
MGKIMKLPVENLVSLSNIFKAEGFTVAVRDAEVIKKDSNGNKVKTTVKKPYLVGIGGTKLLDLPVLDITDSNFNASSKSASSSIKSDSSSNKSAKITKETNKSKVLIDTNSNIIKYSSKIRLYGFMELLGKLGCALLCVDSPGKSLLKGISDFNGIEVTLPNLVCEDSFDIKLRYQRIGIANLPDKTKVLVRKEVDRFICKDFNMTERLTVVCGAKNLDNLSKLFDNTNKHLLDDKVSKVIAALLGNKFNLEKEMYYFNLDITSMNFGRSKTVSLNEMDSESVSKMLHSYIEYSIRRDMINNIWDKSKLRDTDNVHPMLKDKSKEALDKLSKIGVNLEKGTVGNSTPLKSNNDLVITDKRAPFSFTRIIYTKGIIEFFKDRFKYMHTESGDIDGCLDSISGKMDNEIFETGKSDYTFGMSEKDKSIYTIYDAHLETACNSLGHIFNGSRNIQVVNQYLRNKLDWFTEKANNGLLDIVDALVKCKDKNTLKLGNYFKVLGRTNDTKLMSIVPADDEWVESKYVIMLTNLDASV